MDGVLRDTVRAFVAIFGQPEMVGLLLVTAVACLGLSFFVAGRLGWGAVATFLAMMNLVGVLLVMFIGGGRDGSRVIDVELLSGCVVNEAWRAEQLVLNLILYAPFTAFFVLATRRVPGPLLVALGLVFLLEFAQTVTNSGVCELTDLVLNASGAVLGAVAGAVLLAVRNAGTGPGRDPGPAPR